MNLSAAIGVALLGLLWAFTAWQARTIARTFPARGTFVEIAPGARLHVLQQRGVGIERGTVVLLHGASGNAADMMAPLGDRLAALGFRVMAPDRPGHGWSDRPEGADDASPARQARLIQAALTRLGVTHAVVLGHSWSGALATALALDFPDFTDGLVLVAPVLYPWPGGVAWYNAPAASPLWGPLFTHLLALPAGLVLLPAGVAEVFWPQSPPAGFAERTGVRLLLRPATFTANAQDVLGLHAFVTGQAARLPSIAVPTAIVTGDSDRVVSPALHSERAGKEIVGARLTMLPGVGHSPHWSAPEAVIAAVLEVAGRAEARTTTAAAPQGPRPPAQPL